MGFRVRIGGLTINLGWLFGRKKNKDKREEVETREEFVEEEGTLTGEALKDAVLNCCEQSGTFEAFGIEDPEVIDTLCASVASILEGLELTHPTLSNALGEGFAAHGYEVRGDLSSTFASAFISSYR